MHRRKPSPNGVEKTGQALALLKRLEPKKPKRARTLASYDPEVVHMLGFPKGSGPELVKKTLKALFRTRCKPCWELKYCPYGPLVEDFPLPRIIRADAIQHNEFLKQQLNDDKYKGERERDFSEEVKNFDPSEFPEQIPEEEEFMSCHIFGHLCPVFFMAESFTETGNLRKGDSSISFQTKLRVARRDNYTCQECGKLLREHELEFDHIIPRSLGGTSDEHNIRLTCLKCNRTKGNKVHL